MKFISYIDSENHEHFFDPTTVKFTMSVPLGTMETGEPAEGWGCKVCLGDHIFIIAKDCLLYTSPSPRDRQKSRMPSSA